jgi:hypothetical protein
VLILPFFHYPSASRHQKVRSWGVSAITQSTKFGFSNDSAVQLNYQRPYRRGYGYQIFYVVSRAFRVGGNTFRDNTLYPAANFAPGVIPKGMDVGTVLEPGREFNRWQNYRPDTAIPLHRITFNGIVDVPFGKGRRFLKNSNRFLNALVGGYQIAFMGTVVSQSFQVTNTNFGATNPIKLYKGRGTGDGLPVGRLPPGVANFGNNNVTVTLNNGQQVTTAFSPGPSGVNPYNAMVLQGPKNFQSDISLYKEFAFKERFRLRFNVDAFNAFNIQGLRNPGETDGIQQLQTSYWTPRQVQFTGRFTF